MQERNDQVGWSDAQWNRIRQVVREEASKGRVAASFLPIYGSIPPGTQVVPSERLNASDWSVDDAAIAPLLEIECTITLSQSQGREEDLSTALLQFSRAANALARLEDWSIFNGRRYLFNLSNRVPHKISGVIETKGGEKPSWGELADKRLDKASAETQDRLLATEKLPDDRKQAELQRILRIANERQPDADMIAARMRNRLIMTNPGGLGLIEGAGIPIVKEVLDNYTLFDAITDAIKELEVRGHTGPFVSVLGAEAFKVANTPPRAAGSLVLPRDRIEPFLGRELLRSSIIDDRDWDVGKPAARALVMSIAGDSMDLAMAVDVTPEFRRIDDRGRYEFRVYERFALRIKQRDAIASLEFDRVSR